MRFIDVDLAELIEKGQVNLAWPISHLTPRPPSLIARASLGKGVTQLLLSPLPQRGRGEGGGGRSPLLLKERGGGCGLLR